VIARANGLLTDESRKSLSQLLGQIVFGLHMKSVFIKPDSCYVELPDFSFALHDSKKFIIVRPVWEEDNEGEDCGWLEITTEDTYENTTFDYLRRTTAVSSIISLTPASPINRITLLSKNFWTFATNGETWVYHFAILVEHKERFKYLISYRPGPICWLRFTFDEKEIEATLQSAEKSEIL
jgi:hypothetical protein